LVSFAVTKAGNPDKVFFNVPNVFVYEDAGQLSLVSRLSFIPKESFKVEFRHLTPTSNFKTIYKTAFTIFFGGDKDYPQGSYTRDF